MGIRSVIGIYGISNIPKDIASLLDELGVTGFVYCVDNDKAGEGGASNLRTLLHGSRWRGEQDYRKFAGPGIPDKGDANDLLCHHFQDMSRARAALDALPKFSPGIKPQPDTKTIQGNQPRPARVGRGRGRALRHKQGNAADPSTARPRRR